MTIINSKTISRIAAIQVLYQIVEDDESQDTDLLLQRVKEYYKDTELLEDLEVSNKKIKIKLNQSFFEELCHITITNLAKVDEMIKTHLLPEWNFENLHINLKAIVRCGVAELMFFDKIPPKVTINEYTNIASDMLKSQEVGFVNSILDTINKETSKDAS